MNLLKPLYLKYKSFEARSSDLLHAVFEIRRHLNAIQGMATVVTERLRNDAQAVIITLQCVESGFSVVAASVLLRPGEERDISVPIGGLFAGSEKGLQPVDLAWQLEGPLDARAMVLLGNLMLGSSEGARGCEGYLIHIEPGSVLNFRIQRSFYPDQHRRTIEAIQFFPLPKSEVK